MGTLEVVVALILVTTEVEKLKEGGRRGWTGGWREGEGGDGGRRR